MADYQIITPEMEIPFDYIFGGALNLGEAEFLYGDNAYDLTDATVRVIIKTKYTDKDEDALCTYDITDHTDPTNGITEIIVPSTELTNLVIGTKPYMTVEIQAGESIEPVPAIRVRLNVLWNNRGLG